ncbi:MAG TPA: hypothetical protein VHU83_24185 [Bryobacteraceae bacterium]|nr:hypothetical protein [Bryobacteraceae bacterium]
MSLQSTPDADGRLVLLSHPDWLKLLRHFELGEGFALLMLLAGDSSLARLCRTELDLWLLARERPRVFALPIEKPEDLETFPKRFWLSRRRTVPSGSTAAAPASFTSEPGRNAP